MISSIKHHWFTFVANLIFLNLPEWLSHPTPTTSSNVPENVQALRKLLCQKLVGFNVVTFFQIAMTMSLIMLRFAYFLGKKYFTVHSESLA